MKAIVTLIMPLFVYIGFFGCIAVGCIVSGSTWPLLFLFFAPKYSFEYSSKPKDQSCESRTPSE